MNVFVLYNIYLRLSFISIVLLDVKRKYNSDTVLIVSNLLGVFSCISLEWTLVDVPCNKKLDCAIDPRGFSRCISTLT